MGQHRYNVQQTNGTIATVVLSEDEAEKMGLTPAQRLDAEEPEKPASRGRRKAAAKPQNKAARAPRNKAPEIPPEAIAAANDTTIPAVEVSDTDGSGGDPTVPS